MPEDERIVFFGVGIGFNIFQYQMEVMRGFIGGLDGGANMPETVAEVFNFISETVPLRNMTAAQFDEFRNDLRNMLDVVEAEKSLFGEYRKSFHSVLFRVSGNLAVCCNNRVRWLSSFFL